MLIRQCFVDESIYADLGIVVTAFVFAGPDFEAEVAQALRDAGIDSPSEEFKSSARMDADPRMRSARDSLLSIAGRRSRIAVFFGPFSRPRLGRQVLQAAQSVLVRNAIPRESLRIYFDQEIFSSQAEADRLQSVFHYLKPSTLCAAEDSRLRVGVQVADCVAHSFGQIIKAALTGSGKEIDIGGAGAGYPEGTMAPLGSTLLKSLRDALLTRPVIYNGETYAPEGDPVVLDPLNDDPVDFAQHPILLGWGVQVAPESEPPLREAAERAVARIWLGCTR